MCDTGPLLHLAEADCLGFLRLTGDVQIPPAVSAELNELRPTSWVQVKGWTRVTPLSPAHRSAAEAWQRAGLLHGGEAEAVELARQMRPDWLLTDDASARLVAESLGLEVHGSLGVVLWAAAAGHSSRDSAKAALNRLAKSSLWISGSVLAEAISALDQIFERSKS